MLETYVTDASAPRDSELFVAGRADYPNPYLRKVIESFCRMVPKQTRADSIAIPESWSPRRVSFSSRIQGF